MDRDALHRLWVRTLEELDIDPQEEIEVEEIAAPAFSERTALPVMGVGTMRAVFDLGDDTVIKLPIYQGSDANMSECARWRAYSDRHEGRWLAPVVDCASDGRWLIQQKVEPMSRDELKAILADSRVWHELAALDIQDFHAPMQWGLLDGRAVLVDYGTWRQLGDSVEDIKERLLERPL